MYKAVRNVLALCLLVAAAVGTWYWRQPGQPGPGLAESRGAPPGYYLRDAVLLETDASGRVSYRIHAALVEERPRDGALLLNDVLVEYQPAEEIPWRVRAARGEARPDEAALELEGGVELTREPGEDGQATTVRMERLLLLPEQHLASASGGVSFRVGPNALEAVGMKAFLKEDRLELESNVHGRFRP